MHIRLTNYCALLAILSACGVSGPKDVANPLYDPSTATECPAVDATNRYLDAPLFHDLVATGAAVEAIVGFDAHAHDTLLAADPEIASARMHVYYELHAPLDPTKPVLLYLPGGPGDDHGTMHDFGLFPGLTEQFNLVSMDHRGVGCSRSSLQESTPPEAYFMRHAATDIELLRRELVGPNGKLLILGHSYGTALTQTYALLYPQGVERVALFSALHRATDFNEARETYVRRVADALPAGRFEAFAAKHPEYADQFLRKVSRAMYSYFDRLELPSLLDKVEAHLAASELSEVDELLGGSWLEINDVLRSVGCLEALSSTMQSPSEFDFIPELTSACHAVLAEHTPSFFDYSSSLPRLTAPVLLFGGEHDLVTTSTAMSAMAALLPNAYYYNDPHLSHWTWEKPLCMGSVLVEFLAGAEAPRLDELVRAPACTEKPAR